ncbi:endonuclease/exonuclease/phosphatase family protein [soil metagenome]
MSLLPQAIRSSPLRLVTWNCKGAFPRKHAAIAALNPDVLVVPEAGRLDALDRVAGHRAVHDIRWIGDNERKGLAVISYGDVTLTTHPSYDPSLRWILPLEVGGPVPYTLFAVWMMPHVTSRFYAQSLFEACDTYRDLLEAPRVAMAGDFNNNVSFDRPRHPWSYARLLERFDALGLRSLYHLDRGCAHGSERHATFFMYHDAAKRHHLDYIFAKPALYADGFRIAVGTHAKWSAASDHVPLACSFDAGRRNPHGE